MPYLSTVELQKEILYNKELATRLGEMADEAPKVGSDFPVRVTLQYGGCYVVEFDLQQVIAPPLIADLMRKAQWAFLQKSQDYEQQLAFLKRGISDGFQK